MESASHILISTSALLLSSSCFATCNSARLLAADVDRKGTTSLDVLQSSQGSSMFSSLHSPATTSDRRPLAPCRLRTPHRSLQVPSTTIAFLIYSLTLHPITSGLPLVLLQPHPRHSPRVPGPALNPPPPCASPTRSLAFRTSPPTSPTPLAFHPGALRSATTAPAHPAYGRQSRPPPGPSAPTTTPSMSSRPIRGDTTQTLS